MLLAFAVLVHENKSTVSVHRNITALQAHLLKMADSYIRVRKATPYAQAFVLLTLSLTIDHRL